MHEGSQVIYDYHCGGVYQRRLHRPDLHFASSLGQNSPLMCSYTINSETKSFVVHCMCQGTVVLLSPTLDASLGRKGVAVATETKSGKVVVMQG